MTSLLNSVGGAVQRRLGEALRSKVAGEDADTHAARIWGSSGERWFTPEDPVWRVHEDASMFPGGIAALLLQSLHPLAMAGVTDHSGYRGDPWGRLQRISHYLATTTYGTVADAERAIAAVSRVHRTVTGERDGVPYAASDPALLRWVHVAEVWSFLHAFQAYARTPLTPAEADTYVAQAGLPALLLGADRVPGTVAELDAEIAAFRSELRGTAEARDVARFLLLDPPLPMLVRPGYGLIAAGGVALLPAWARRALLLPVLGPAVPVARLSGSVAAGLVRWGMAGVSPNR
ncbi:MAG: oxygenase MpaB family protein [Marmoricola sp.]